MIGLNRADALDRLRAAGETEVLIVGGGVNGAGLFRELALQGVRAILVERDDFAAGASGASTRMAHGGIRYLEQGYVRLVRETVLERNRLLRNAPHLVSPIAVTIPTDNFLGGLLTASLRLLGWNKRRSSVPGLIVLALGLFLYDFLGRRGRLLPPWGVALGRRARALVPGMARPYRALGWTWDGAIRHPERIVVELIEDGVNAEDGSIALNHCAVEGRERDHIILHDRLSGEIFRLRPRIVVNTAGAWADSVNRRLGLEGGSVIVSKGTHLFLDNPALRAALGGRLIYFADRRGRMCILYAVANRVLLGTTDIAIEDADAAATEEDETTYLLDSARALFPGIAIDAGQIRFTTCGVRSLRQSAGNDVGAISRDYAILHHGATHGLPFELLTLVGGKWTTFRAAAEKLGDAVLVALGRFRKTSTAALAIGGGRGFPATDSERSAWISRRAAATGLSAERIKVLFARYGTRAAAIAAFYAEAEDRALPGASDYSEHELRFLVRHEMAVTLADLFLRRTTVALEGRLTIRAVDLAARIISEETGRHVSDFERRNFAELLVRSHRAALLGTGVAIMGAA